MKCAKSLGVAMLVLVSSCAGFPTKNLDLDFTNQEVPVMLSPVASTEKTRTIHLESGYTTASVSTSASSGGVTVSSSATMGVDSNIPVGLQFQNLIVVEPRWSSLTLYKIQTERSDVLLIYSYASNLKYLGTFEFSVPTGKAAK